MSPKKFSNKADRDHYNSEPPIKWVARIGRSFIICLLWSFFWAYFDFFIFNWNIYIYQCFIYKIKKNKLSWTITCPHSITPTSTDGTSNQSCLIWSSSCLNCIRMTRYVTTEVKTCKKDGNIMNCVLRVKKKVIWYHINDCIINIKISERCYCCIIVEVSNEERLNLFNKTRATLKQLWNHHQHN